MADPRALIEQAYARLRARGGYSERPDQLQLSFLIADCIEGKASGVFEAPTGLGKSLAALISAFAHAIAGNKRIAISTYTNVLAEQYWRNEIRIAADLFEESVRCEFLIGRQRFACVNAIDSTMPRLRREFIARAELGIESEFRELIKGTPRQISDTWDMIAAPPVCPARLCPSYSDCVYYKRRRGAERANIVITNHSVLIQDALLRKVTNGSQSLLGELDFAVIDEAHDLPEAARGALEFELSERTLGLLIGLANRLEQVALPVAAEVDRMSDWANACEQFRSQISECQARLHDYCMRLRRNGILAASPNDLWNAKEVSAAAIVDALPDAQTVVNDVVDRVSGFIETAKRLCSFMPSKSEDAELVRETTAVYLGYFSEFREQAEMLFAPTGVSVTHAEKVRTGGTIRRAVVDAAEPLRELIWDRLPAACMSATLAIDGDFDWFKRVSGIRPDFQEILPVAFNYKENAAVYFPPAGIVPDPSRARQEGDMDSYYQAIAKQIALVIAQMGGRTLVLFHSREEMERVKQILDAHGEMKIHMQRRSGAGHFGKQFRDDIESSLFGLRSFWTGFDAPGETLSCVCIVRIPFEVPIDPESVVRNAYLRESGMDPFVTHTLPQAKLLMRQGVGRLLRTDSDRGVIAILDPRIATKRYGVEILENLPRGLRAFSNFVDAMSHAGLELPQAL